jgi:uncharacterized protein YegP (UPF0339 family)
MSGCQTTISEFRAKTELNPSGRIRMMMAVWQKKNTNNKDYFNLKANNGQVIGISEMYESKSSMEVGIASVKKNAPGASVEG